MIYLNVCYFYEYILYTYRYIRVYTYVHVYRYIYIYISLNSDASFLAFFVKVKGRWARAKGCYCSFGGLLMCRIWTLKIPSIATSHWWKCVTYEPLKFPFPKLTGCLVGLIFRFWGTFLRFFVRLATQEAVDKDEYGGLKREGLDGLPV